MSTDTLARKAGVAIWDRVVRFEKDLSPTAARAILKLRFSPPEKVRMHDLAAKARAASLTPQEQVEIDTYEQLGCLLDILHSKARRSLGKRRSTS